MNYSIPTTDEIIKKIRADKARIAPKKQVHNSSLERYFQCGEDFRLAVIEEIPTPKSTALIVGSAVDESVTANMIQKMHFMDLLPLEKVEAIARDSVKKAFEVEVFLKTGNERESGRDVVRGATIDKAVRMAKAHYEHFAPNINPIRVQWHWVLKWDGYPYRIVGSVDIVDRDEMEQENIIADTKTTAKTPQKDIADISTQLSTYALAESINNNGIIPKVRLDYLIDLKKGVNCVPYHSTRDKADFQRIRNRLQIFADSMKAGIFNPCSVGHWKCSENFCGYWEKICQYPWRSKTIFE